MLAQEGLVDKVTSEQKAEGDGVDRANPMVKTTRNRGSSRFKDSEVGAYMTSVQPEEGKAHQLGLVAKRPTSRGP